MYLKIYIPKRKKNEKQQISETSIHHNSSKPFHLSIYFTPKNLKKKHIFKKNNKFLIT